MKDFLNKFLHREASNTINSADDQLKRQVAALYGLYSGIIGSDKVVFKAGKLDALNLMSSERLADKVLALQKLVFEDPTVDKVPTREEIPAILTEIEDELADLLARRTVEEKIEKKINEKMEEKHQEYIKEIRMQVLAEEQNAESPQTLKKYARLEVLEQKRLTAATMDQLRPAGMRCCG